MYAKRITFNFTITVGHLPATAFLQLDKLNLALRKAIADEKFYIAALAQECLSRAE